MNLSKGLIWIGGVGIPAIALAWAKVESETYIVLFMLGVCCLFATILSD